jgi:hypothetical protein
MKQKERDEMIGSAHKANTREAYSNGGKNGPKQIVSPVFFVPMGFHSQQSVSPVAGWQPAGRSRGMLVHGPGTQND